MKIDKGEVLTGFEEALNKNLAKWASADKERNKKYRDEMRMRSLQRKKAEKGEVGEGGGKMKEGGGSKGKGKEKAAAIITIDEDSEEEEEYVDA
jgi:hypothetical protein